MSILVCSKGFITAKRPQLLLRKNCQRGFCDIDTLIPSDNLSRLIELIQKTMQIESCDVVNLGSINSLLLY